MANLDDMFDALARSASPPELDALDTRVMAQIRLHAERDRRVPPRVAIVAAIVATAMGMAGAGLPAPTPAAASLAPLGGVSPLAPSTLLLGAE